MSQPAPLRGIKPRAYRDLIEKAVRQGWTVKPTGSGHLRLDPPPGSTVGPVFPAKTSGGGNAVNNLRSVLRQHGVDC